MSITIRPECEALLRARAEDEGITVEQYVERIARQEQQAIEEIDALALQGLESGESIRADNDQFWNERHSRLIERYSKPQS